LSQVRICTKRPGFAGSPLEDRDPSVAADRTDEKGMRRFSLRDCGIGTQLAVVVLYTSNFDIETAA
jgi:hypothetical protein